MPAEALVNAFSSYSFTQVMLKAAWQQRASDIHIEPQMAEVRIRFRIDGLLKEYLRFSRAQAHLLVNHLKILAQLDIAESRFPQDGSFSFYLENDLAKECRLSSCPSIHGEKLVIRLLKNSQELGGIVDLGFSAEALQLFLHSLQQTQGLILVTGPTGSGKSLTLYHALALLNQSTRNIISIEDPVEIKVPGITQVNINRAIGFDFARALRSFLRQDPDVIMLGEIRDAETAEMVVKAAQTGHLVLSTLHTNDALSSINRLNSLGVAHYNIADTLKLVIAQRLLRKICRHCRGKSCEQCQGGYHERIGVYEVLKITDSLAQAIASKATYHQLTEIALQHGFENLQTAALAKVKTGLTNLVELKRVIPESELTGYC